MSRATVDQMPWTPAFRVSRDGVQLACADSAEACTAAFKAVVDAAVDGHHFMDVLDGQHSEMFRVLGAKYALQTPGPDGQVRVERFAADLFGLVARGAHLTVYTTEPSTGEMKIWVPRRSASSFTFPNCLDTTVAGGVPSHQTPFENIIQEADEEASLPAELIRRDVRSAGALSYVALSAQGHVAPDVVYLYDLEVCSDVVPVPQDGEVKEFYLMSAGEVKTALAGGEFKTNSAVVMVEFLVRHGLVRAEEVGEGVLVELGQRMHRRLPFPVAPDGVV